MKEMHLKKIAERFLIMYEKLKLVLNEGDKLKDNCKKIFDERFRAEIMTSKIEKLYEELL